MPSIRSLASVCYILLTASISLNGEIISPYSYYIKKGLVYIIITTFFSYQPSSYFKCTKANTYFLCNVRSVSINKYTSRFFCDAHYLSQLWGGNTWWYIASLALYNTF